MLVLNKEAIKSVFSMSDAIFASKEALCNYSLGKATVPLRASIDIIKHNGKSLFMPAYVEGLDALGIKVVSIFPKNIEVAKPSISAQMILIDAKTGEVCALLDGTYVTQLRTGALQGAATEILARADAKKALLIGAGGQAASQLEAMLNARNLEDIFVFDIDFKRAENFVLSMKKVAEKFNTEITAVESVNNAVKFADIITTVTASTQPVFDGSLVKEGTHINAIGAYTPLMQEIPSKLVQRADKILFDTLDGVMSEAGDILIPLKEGLVSEKDFNGELGEVLLGKIKGRETDKELTLFKSVGSAVFDVVTAHHIYKQALATQVGQTIEL